MAESDRQAAQGSLHLRAANRHPAYQARQDSRRYRTRRQSYPRPGRRDRLQDRYRRRRHRADRLRRRRRDGDRRSSRFEAITAEPEVGRIYNGKVRKIVDFGAFVEIMPGTDGLLHISQLSNERVRRVEDVLHEGDEIMVKVLDVDRSGKIRLSLREAQAGPRTEGEIGASMVRKSVLSNGVRVLTEPMPQWCRRRSASGSRTVRATSTNSPERRLALHRASALQGHEKAHRRANRRRNRRGRRRAQRVYRQGIHLLLRQGSRRRPEDGDRLCSPISSSSRSSIPTRSIASARSCCRRSRRPRTRPTISSTTSSI